MLTRPRVFIVSPLRTCTEHSQKDHERLAEVLSRSAVMAGFSPFTPHLLFTRFLDDMVAAERGFGIQCGAVWLEVADEVWVFDADTGVVGGISGGMKAEISAARDRKIPVLYPRDLLSRYGVDWTGIFWPIG